MSTRAQRALNHLTVTVTQWGQDGDVLQQAVVPASTLHLAPWLILAADVYAVTIESSHAGRGLIHLRDGWAPPRLTPLWERWLDVRLEVVTKETP